ncbi:hypothetical protein D3C75_1225420 [compost metagenome]
MHASNQIDDIFNVEGLTKWSIQHVSTSGESHFGFLQMEASMRKEIYVSSMIVMHVGDDHFADISRCQS